MNNYIFLILAFAVLAKANDKQEFYTRDVTIPLSTFAGEDRFLYACMKIELQPDEWITGFEPLVKPHAVHHMSVQMCDSVWENEPDVWNCLDPKKVCKTGKDALYAYGNGAPKWILPDIAGIYTGADKRYIVYQVHGHHEGDVQPGSAGIRLHFRRSKPQYDAAMMVLGNVGYIPAHERDFTTDSACIWNVDVDSPILNYGLHTHEHGTSISGYIIRNGTWIEIGRGDPNYPLVLYDVTHKNLTMQKGDFIAARCTFDNNEDRNLKMGYGDENEMCNLYVHYGVPNDAPDYLRTTSCVANIQEYKWEDVFTDIPSLASDTSGDTDQNRYVIKHHMSKIKY